MIVRVTSELPLPAETACAMAQNPAVFKHVVWPVFTIGAIPDTFDTGATISARLYFLGAIPGWRHHLRLISASERMLYTNEHGGLVTTWNHRLTFEPTSERSCRYTDEVEIEAGISTLPTVAVAHLMYRWRHRRWRKLAALVPV